MHSSDRNACVEENEGNRRRTSCVLRMLKRRSLDRLLFIISSMTKLNDLALPYFSGEVLLIVAERLLPEHRS